MGSRELLPKEILPTIDISEILASSSKNCPNLQSKSATKIVQEIKSCCLQWGFFYLVGHGVSSDLIDNLKKVSMDFFKKPKDTKKLIQRQPNNFRGYSDSELTKQKQDWKETFDFGAEYPSENDGIEFDPGRNQWPENMDHDHFKKTLLQYYTAMHSLSSILMDLIFMSLQVEPLTMRHHFKENGDTSFCRLNYYPACPNSTDKFGVGPHADAGVLTVLLQDDNVSSLQVEKGGQFHDVHPIPGSFVINIGNMMQVWSNGLFPAPVHRVLAHPNKERFSVPFFFNPAYKSNIEPVEQCVTKDRPRRYRPVNWGLFRQTRILGNYADHGEEIQIYHFEI